MCTNIAEIKHSQVAYDPLCFVQELLNSSILRLVKLSYGVQELLESRILILVKFLIVVQELWESNMIILVTLLTCVQ